MYSKLNAEMAFEAFIASSINEQWIVNFDVKKFRMDLQNLSV